MTEQLSAALAPPSPVPASGDSRSLLRKESLPADRHPAAVYLASLAPGSRRTMRQALGVVATLISGGRADARTLAWEKVRYQHCQAVRSQLAERYSPASVIPSGFIWPLWHLARVERCNMRSE